MAKFCFSVEVVYFVFKSFPALRTSQFEVPERVPPIIECHANCLNSDFFEVIRLDFFHTGVTSVR